MIHDIAYWNMLNFMYIIFRYEHKEKCLHLTLVKSYIGIVIRTGYGDSDFGTFSLALSQLRI